MCVKGEKKTEMTMFVTVAMNWLFVSKFWLYP